jgi:predicted SAM-dependent methyltransferase
MLNKIQEKINQKSLVKLHLGCGTIHLDGYINIDGDYMSHDPNVTLHDITKTFPLPDNCVDEILTVHVIEHLSRQYVPPMFKEFYRICKPGGCVAMEWPDLLKMCQEVVSNPDCFWTQDKRLVKRTISGIYGDSARYPDPTMLHKWGYSAESMRRLFLEAGFSRAETQSNVHQKTHIDSRVVAYK